MVGQYKKIKTAENIFTIIKRIDKLDQPTCSMLSEEVDLSMSSIYNYLKTLEGLGYVIEQDGRYRLSLQFLQHGRRIRNSYPIMRAATEPVDILANLIDEYISVFVKEQRRVVMIHEANSSHAVRTPSPFLGEPFHLVNTPQGRVMLAHTDESFQQEVIAEHAPEQVSIDTLHEELQSIRAEGYNVDRGRSHENIWAVAAPVTVGGELHGALMISTVLHRFDEQQEKEELQALLLQTVKEVEHRLSRYDFDDIYENW